MKLSELKSARDELDTVLSLDPKIKFTGDLKQFKEDILSASELLTLDDEISKETEKTLKLLKGEKHGGVGEKTSKKKKKIDKQDVKGKKKKKGKVGVESGKSSCSSSFATLLQSVARNLNDALDLDPKIDLDKKPDELREDIIAASSLINKSDRDITEISKDVISELRASLGKSLFEIEKKFIGESQVKVKDKLKDKLKAKVKPVSVEKKKEEKTKKKVSSKPSDSRGRGVMNEFGFRVGSNRDLFCQSLVAKPKTMTEIQREKWNTPCETFYDTWKKLVERGFGIRTPEGLMKIVKKGTTKK